MFRWGIEKTFTLESDDRRALRERIGATVREHLQEKPDATLEQLSARLWQKHSVVLSLPALCRMRQELGLSPDNQQARAAATQGLRTRSRVGV